MKGNVIKNEVAKWLFKEQVKKERQKVLEE